MTTNPSVKLDELLQMAHETEVVEFKAANRNFDFHKLGKYFSALSNEANLRKCNVAWLVFGIEDKTHRIVGTQYCSNSKELQKLNHEIAEQTTNRISFQGIYEITRPEGRVILFEIPAAPKGMPVAFQGHYYGREGESLAALTLSEIERIRSQSNTVDWSKDIIPEATLDDLDSEAIRVARDNFKIRNRNLAGQVDNWDDTTFLNKAKVTIKGQITGTAILLLGKSESSHLLPRPVKIRWLLKDSSGNHLDFHHETCPFILAIDRIYAKIRNLRYRYIPAGTLFSQEIETYAPFVIREALCNCIAHQDYQQGDFISVVELDDRLVFSNRGSFLPGSVEKVVIQNAPEDNYRNPFLAEAMFHLNLIETRGGGIREMFCQQRNRFFPLPEYELSPNSVVATIIGKVLDVTYAEILVRNPTLDLEEIITLDKVSKKKTLIPEEERHLRKKKLIEGRKPNFFLAKDVAQKTAQKAEYSKLKGFDEQYYIDLLLKALREHGTLNRKEVDQLLRSKLPDVLTEEQKTSKIRNLLTKLKNDGTIERDGWSKQAVWKLTDKK